MPEPVQEGSSFKDLVVKVVRQILKVYDLADQDEVELGADYDYRLNVIEDNRMLKVNIDADNDLGRILAGKRKSNLRAMQKLLISALHFRLEHGLDEPLERFVRLSVNGQIPEPENGDEERPVEKPEKKIVTLIVPSGVEVRTLNPDGTTL